MGDGATLPGMPFAARTESAGCAEAGRRPTERLVSSKRQVIEIRARPD